MTIPALSATKTICELREWSVSNLEAQKLLYLAHMFQLGRTDGAMPLVHEEFEAWDYGPVVPSVYRHVKGFGRSAIPNVFHWIPSAAVGTPEHDTIREVVESTRGLSPGRLVAITHWDRGAWAKHYVAGARGIQIPNADILREYRERAAD